eukprot:ctg_1225.g450
MLEAATLTAVLAPGEYVSATPYVLDDTGASTALPPQKTAIAFGFVHAIESESDTALVVDLDRDCSAWLQQRLPDTHDPKASAATAAQAAVQWRIDREELSSGFSTQYGNLEALLYPEAERLRQLVVDCAPPHFDTDAEDEMVLSGCRWSDPTHRIDLNAEQRQACRQHRAAAASVHRRGGGRRRQRSRRFVGGVQPSPGSSAAGGGHLHGHQQPGVLSTHGVRFRDRRRGLADIAAGVAGADSVGAAGVCAGGRPDAAAAAGAQCSGTGERRLRVAVSAAVRCPPRGGVSVAPAIPHGAPDYAAVQRAAVPGGEHGGGSTTRRAVLVDASAVPDAFGGVGGHRGGDGGAHGAGTVGTRCCGGRNRRYGPVAGASAAAAGDAGAASARGGRPAGIARVSHHRPVPGARQGCDAGVAGAPQYRRPHWRGVARLASHQRGHHPRPQEIDPDRVEYHLAHQSLFGAIDRMGAQ